MAKGLAAGRILAWLQLDGEDFPATVGRGYRDEADVGCRIARLLCVTTRAEIPVSALDFPHPNWTDQVNRNVIRSEIEGGVHLDYLPRGAVLEIEMLDWTCRLEYAGEHEGWVSGHPRFCPAPVRVYVAGSTWGGSMLKQYFIGLGMHLEFLHPVHQRILTSRIIEIRELSS